jgi:hypothetical protein
MKGFKVDTDTYVEIDKEELDNIALESTRTIEIDEFVPKTEATSLPACRRQARATLWTSHKKGRRPLDQPKGRHCSDRVRRDHVEPIDCPLNQGRFEAKRHCGAEEAARR